MDNMILSPISLNDLKGMIDASVRNAIQELKQPNEARGDRRIFGVKGLARFVGCSEPRAVELARSKRFNRYQDGRKIFFLESEVLAGLKR